MQRIGFLGCGRVSQRQMEVCRDELKDARVTVVCDIVKEKADLRGKELGAKVVTDINLLLVNKEVDVISIMTESGRHAEHARMALNAGKHVIVEKPPALIPEQIIEIEQLAKSKGLMYSVIFQNRFNPAMQILKKTYDRGRFGKIVLSTVRLRWCRYQSYYEDGWHGTWKMDGGVINQQAIHHIDALQWVCGEITEVVASQTNALNKLEAEDTLVAVVKFANGGLGTIEATTAARPVDFEASISIVGELGSAVVGGIALNKIDAWQFVEPELQDATIPIDYSQEVPTGYGLSHGPLMQEIIDRLNQGRIDPPISGTDVLPTVQLVHALYRSVEIKSWIKLSDKPLSEKLGR